MMCAMHTDVWIFVDVISDQDALLKATGLAGEDQPLGYDPFNHSHVVAAAEFIKAGLDLVSVKANL
jgi:hypothetical protein